MLETKVILDAHIKFFTMLLVIIPIQPKKDLQPNHNVYLFNSHKKLKLSKNT